MSTPAWISLLVTAAVFVALQRKGRLPADLLFLGGLVAVTLAGVITPAQAISGFANPALVTIGALFVVAAGLRSAGVLDWLGDRLLGQARTPDQVLHRLALVTVAVSAFVNNTPVVAMFVPVVLAWCRRRAVSPSKLLIPLSYLTILGGTCTLVGTSTNLVLNGKFREGREAEAMLPAGPPAYRAAFERELRDLTLFEMGHVGFPCVVVGAAYLLLAGKRLLPDRSELLERFDEQRREFLVEMLVQPECRLIGKTVEEAGLRHLRGLFLIEIDRGDAILTPVTPRDVIEAGDRLIFAGVVSTIVDLVQIQGLVPAADLTYEVHPLRRRQRFLSEAVISNTSPLLGMTIREANFRQRYDAAVVAVHRNGEPVSEKIGDVRIQPGDTLLLQTRVEFPQRFRNSPDFYLVAPVEGSSPRRHDRGWIAIGLLTLFIVWLGLANWLGPTAAGAAWSAPAVVALVVAGLMVGFRCLPVAEARGAIDLEVLITIAAALGLGQALSQSGAATAIAEGLVATVGRHPYLLLLVLYLLAAVFTEMITNVAVAAMLFPLAVATANASGFSPRPFAIAIGLAASLSFVTPIGYQTNLMVMGPGGYEARDYLKIGLPLFVLTATTAMLVIPWAWPFQLELP